MIVWIAFRLGAKGLRCMTPGGLFGADAAGMEERLLAIQRREANFRGVWLPLVWKSGRENLSDSAVKPLRCEGLWVSLGYVLTYLRVCFSPVIRREGSVAGVRFARS